MPKDYYFILGVNPDADLKKIKRAYRQRVKQHHPDVAEGGQNCDRFIEVQEAYQVLSNAESRRRYDRRCDDRRKTGLPPRDHHRRPSGPGDRSRRQASPFFPRPSARSREFSLEIVLARWEAAQGGEFSLAIPVTVACPWCRQSALGWGPLCPLCFGSGAIRHRHSITLQLPPQVAHGTEVRLSLARAGLPGMYLHLRIRVETGDYP